eukprot:scaffold8728_cov164-Amphora_coffeaeformis.AAC.18
MQNSLYHLIDAPTDFPHSFKALKEVRRCTSGPSLSQHNTDAWCSLQWLVLCVESHDGSTRAPANLRSSGASGA